MCSPRLLLAALFLIALPAAALRAGDEKDSPFEGYSRQAEGLIENLFRSARNLKSYSDDGVMRFETDAAWKQPDQKVTFLYAKPGRFVIDTDAHHVVSDGKELTVHMKQTGRYKSEALKEDVGKQVAEYLGEFGMIFTVADMVLDADPRKKFAKMFKELEVGERETIEGDRCIGLNGHFGMPIFVGGDLKMPVTVLLREDDHLIRRIRIDFSEAMKKQAEENPGMGMNSDYKMVYDVRAIKVNESVDAAKFKFDAPSGAKKVDKFYNRWGMGADTAEQFERSGKPAPDFELSSTAGDHVRLSALKGKVVVLNFLFGHVGGGQDMNSKALAKARADLAGKDVEFLSILPEDSADKVIERYREENIDLPILLDGDREAFDGYFDQAYDGGIILVGKDGVIQGRYRMLFNEERADALRKDLEKLLAGETLPSGKPMSEEELSEYVDQTGMSYSTGAGAEPVAPDALVEAWSVRVRGNNSYSYGAGDIDAAGDLWVRDGRSLRRIGHDGAVAAEIVLPSKGTDPYVQESVVVGRIGRQLGAVFMATVPGDEQQQGWRPPKAVVLTAVAENGDEIWKMEMDVENNNQPQGLALADLDGKPGDELIFFRAGALWVVDDRGQVICRKPVSGWAMSVEAKDRDRDRKAEIYVRTNEKLIRYDYRPKK